MATQTLQPDYAPDEVSEIKKALIHLWSHLDPARHLQPLAVDLDLVNEHGHALD